MSYVNMYEMLKHAKGNGYAVGAFNIVDYSTVKAVIAAAAAKKSPVIVQTSAKTVKHYGYLPIVHWVRTLAEEVSVPVALHLDHCKDIDMIQKCIEAGWSSVMIDASSFPLETNIEMTRKVVEMAKAKDVTVEGELGAIVGIEDDIFVKEQDSHLADPETCVRYVKATGIDLLAPAIGTAHGMYKKEPKIDFKLIESIAAATGLPLAIHGGTGLSEETFLQCIRSGGTKINISTNIKHLFKDSLEKYFRENPDDYEPLKPISFMEKEVAKSVESFIDIFGSKERCI